MFTLVNLECSCPFCGNRHYVEVDEVGYNAYKAGAYVQNAFPYLNATEREQIISGICPICQEDIFGNEDDY